MGCQSSADRLERNLGAFAATSVPELDALYMEADTTLKAFQRDCGTMLIAIDTFETVAGGHKGVPGAVARALTATLIAVIADLDSSGLPARPTRVLPGLEVARFGLTHSESKRAWVLWDSLAGELLVMLKEVERYFPQACNCAKLPVIVDAYLHHLSKNADMRVIDIRKISAVVAFNKTALLQSAGEFHNAVHRLKSILAEALTVLEALHNPARLKRLKELGSAAAKIQAFDPLLVLDHFQSGIKDFLKDVFETKRIDYFRSSWCSSWLCVVKKLFGSSAASASTKTTSSPCRLAFAVLKSAFTVSISPLRIVFCVLRPA